MPSSHKVVIEFEVEGETPHLALRRAIELYLFRSLPSSVVDGRAVAVDGEYLSHAADLELRRAE